MTKQSDTDEIIRLIKALTEKVRDLEDQQKDTETELSVQMIHKHNELLEEFKKLNRRVRELKDDFDSFSKITNPEIKHSQRRLTKIEDHLHLTPAE